MASPWLGENALKQLAAGGILSVMVLGGAYWGGYHLDSPVFVSEAVIQLHPATNTKGGAGGVAGGGVAEQAAVMTSDKTLLFAAWDILKREGYILHETREEWLNFLHVSVGTRFDASKNLIGVNCRGSNSHAVAQVCNALSRAYIQLLETPPAMNAVPFSAGKLVKPAVAAAAPVRDRRHQLGLSLAATVAFVLLLLAMMARLTVRKQLKEIDGMAEAKDWAAMEGEGGF